MASDAMPLEAGAGPAPGRTSALVAGEGASPLIVDRGSCPAPCTWWQRAARGAFARSTLLRSVAFRIGFAFWLLFNLCLAFAGWGAYETLQARVLMRLDEDILERYALIETVHAERGIEAVEALSRERERLPMESAMGFALVGADGARVAGNVEMPPAVEGWSVVTGEALGVPGDTGKYRFLTVELDEHTLALGKSLEPFVEIREVAAHCLLVMFAASTALALLCALWVTQRLRRRADGWSRALERLAGGDLAQRLPVSSVQDSIDDMALTVNAALERLARNVDTMREVSTNIAHDLKTPLNRLHIHLEEAATEVAEGALGTGTGRTGEGGSGEADGASRLERSLEAALEETAHVNATFEALLRVAQIEGGARRRKFAHFDLREVLSTVAEIYEPVVEEACQSLRTGFDPALALPMYGDRELLMQLVVNLVENAVRHCHDGPECEDAGTIEIRGGQSGDGHVWLAVADRGPGIPEAEREKVFQRLYRLERSRTTRGTGLGLSLVRAIAELHCGRVELSDNAPGLCFRVSFDRNCPTEGPGGPTGARGR